ncbi:MAG TPA: hypothetical protein VFL29_12750 [Candidatus Dormibacteraeota bacterium]|nr:hypothetical protein [Candidatus Dormibacteraeota bacterium]
MAPPDELNRRRAIECRLTKDRALKSLREAAAFLDDRGLLTRMPDCALPSLFGACHEAPARPGGRGFDLWPKTRWIWSFQLTRDGGAILTKLHRGKSLYLSTAMARVFDPLVQQAMASATGDDLRLLEHLGRHGPSMAEDVLLELGWDGRRLKSARNRLERIGAVISDGLVFDAGGEATFAPMRRWDAVVKKAPAGEDPLGDVVVAAVRAAVIAPEAEVRSWFSWPVTSETIDRLVAAGRLARAAYPTATADTMSRSLYVR